MTIDDTIAAPGRLTFSFTQSAAEPEPLVARGGGDPEDESSDVFVFWSLLRAACAMTARRLRTEKAFLLY